MDKKPIHQQYSDTVLNQLDSIERKFREVRDLIDFARSWDDENAMFYQYLITRACNVDHMVNAARGNLERLTALADPNTPEDLPF